MRKTIALFAAAFLLIVSAWVLGVRRPPAAPPLSPSPSAPLPVFDSPGEAQITLGERVKLEGKLSNAFVRSGQAGTLHLLMDLVAESSGGGARAPMAVAIVIDRSGSMAGDKINKARQAAKVFSSRLSDEDELAIVTYSNDYAVDLPLTSLKGQRNRVARVIDEILDGGGTNIGDGLNAGIQALRGSASGSVRRLLLVSDGNANQGITDPATLALIARRARDEGITISTLGIGVDFNEDLLTHMAQNAGGGYYYARDGETIAAAFDKELAGINELAARNVEVGLDLGNGVQISEVFGYRTELRRGRIVIAVGDMASGERRRILVQLTTPASSTRLDVSNVVLAYAAPDGKDAREHQGALSVQATQEEAQYASGESRAVVEAFAEARAARAREQAAVSLQAGNKAQALQRIQAQIEASRRANTALKSKALEAQVFEMEETLRGISSSAVDSDDAKDLVKREKLRARQVFTY